MSEQTQDNKSLFNMVVAVLLTVLLVGVMVVPIINTATQTTTTTSIDNEGAGWLKLGYNSGEDFDFEITNDNSNIIIGDQTGTMGDNIFYADSKNVIFADSGKNAIFLLDTESSSVHKFSNTVSVENTEGTLNISDGTETVVSSESPTWAYIPDPAGTYGFFTNGGLTLEDGKPTVAVGSYAGVFAYNDTVVAPNGYGDLGLTMSGNYEEGEVIWTVTPSELDTLNALPTDTLDGPVPIGLMGANPSGGVQVGDLFYKFTGNAAELIGYSSTTDWASLTSLPDTVTYNGNTYTVTSIGVNAFNGAGANLIATSLPSGVTYIGNQAFRGCTNLALTSLPEGLTSTGYSAFSGCTNLALTSLPSGLTTLANRLFENCTNLALTSLPSGVTSIGVSSFEKCTNLALTSLPEGLTTLSQSSFMDCPNITLSKLPDTLTNVSETCFFRDYGVTITVIPASVNTISSGAFGSCNGMDNLILLSSPTIAGTMTFNDTSIKEVLNLGETEITTTSYGLNADSVQDYVSALGYVAPISIHNSITETDGSITSTLMQFLPVILVLALIVLVGTAIIIPRAGLGRYMDR